MDTLAGVAGAASAVEGAVGAMEKLRGLVIKPSPDLLLLQAATAEAEAEILKTKKAQVAVEKQLMELQEQLRKQDRFSKEAERYTLTKTTLGSMVYRLKSDDPRGEPMHDVCAACFQNDVKSVLQPHSGRPNTLLCTRCKGEFAADLGHSTSVMVGGESRGHRGYRF